jgi:hypothetical protein
MNRSKVDEVRAAAIAADAETRAVRKHTTHGEMRGWTLWCNNRLPRSRAEWTGYLAATIFYHPQEP